MNGRPAGHDYAFARLISQQPLDRFIWGNFLGQLHPSYQQLDNSRCMWVTHNELATCKTKGCQLCYNCNILVTTWPITLKLRMHLGTHPARYLCMCHSWGATARALQIYPSSVPYRYTPVVCVIDIPQWGALQIYPSEARYRYTPVGRKLTAPSSMLCCNDQFCHCECAECCFTDSIVWNVFSGLNCPNNTTSTWW